MADLAEVHFEESKRQLHKNTAEDIEDRVPPPGRKLGTSLRVLQGLHHTGASKGRTAPMWVAIHPFIGG